MQASILIRVNPQLAARYFLQGQASKSPPTRSRRKRTCWKSRKISSRLRPDESHHGQDVAYRHRYLSKFLYDNGLTAEVVPVSALITDEFVAYANDFDKKAFIAQAKAMR